MSRTGLWDSHAHLDDEAFNEDREQLIAQLEQDMDGIVNPGCDAASSAVAVELAEKYPFIYAAVGWHPENLKGIPADYLQQLAEWAQHPKVVAIGEIGLDYYWKENEPKEVQKRIFLEQIDLAKQFDLPVIIHDRDAHGDMLELFQNVAHKMDLKTAVERGVLVPIRCIRVKTNIDLTDVRINGIKYNSQDLESKLFIPERNQLIVDTYLKYVNGKKTEKKEYLKTGDKITLGSITLIFENK